MKTLKPFGRLLAKSLSEDPTSLSAATFVGHISAVMRSADVLTKKLGKTILQQLGLQEISIERFIATVNLGAYLHDWGKANQHFQVMVRLKDIAKTDKEKKQLQELKSFWRSINERQMFRHEIISGILAVNVPEIRAWLEQCPDADFKVAVWAAMGHHLKVGGRRGLKIGGIAERVEGTGNSLLIYTQHEHFKALLEMGVKFLSLPSTLPILPKEDWKVEELEAALEDSLESFLTFEQSISDQERRFTAAVKATVLAADVAGSALPAASYPIESWLENTLNLVLSKEEIQKLVSQRLGNNELREFQRNVANSNSRVTLVKAGCGTGKTVAAYAWGLKYAVGKKLFFGYPTTGTASQGYIDYAATTNIESALMHSRADVDLSGVLFSGEAKYDKDPHDSEDAEQVDSRLSSFRAWQAKLIVCTVDSILGLIQNNRKPLYSWPAICQSAFVFDEVHAYDDKLFSALLHFLETFRGAPILLMSASFSPQQLSILESTIQKLGEALNIIEGPTELEELKRYTLHQVPEKSEVWETVIASIEKNKRVLWVTNTVDDCIKTYEEAKTKLKAFKLILLIYHSRFRYEDRVAKHKQVVDSFKTNEAVLAITTQVCEMSLDLSAHLLVSALAPSSALIQRLGRLNRHIPEGSDCHPCPAIIYPWENPMPYGEEIKSGQEYLNILPQGAICQRNLAEASAKLPSQAISRVSSNWLDGNWRSYPGPLREAGYTVTVLLEEDVPLIWASTHKRNTTFSTEAQRYSVPIPLKPGYVSWQRIGVYPIAPTSLITYSSEIGICKA